MLCSLTLVSNTGLMKRIITLAIASLAFSASQAQVSGGLRTGASLWMDKGNGSCFSNSLEGQNKTWDKELFARYTTSGKLAFETSVGHYAFRNHSTPPAGDYTAPGYNNTGLKQSSENIEWNISAQYDVSCPSMKSCPMLSKLKSYIGVVATPTYSSSRTELQYVRLSDGLRTTTVATDNEFAIWTGISHTLIYEVTSNLYLTSSARMQIDPNRFFEKNSGVGSNPDSRVGVQLGVGYNFQ